MLTTDQKELILRRAGIPLPLRQFHDSATRQQQADAEPLWRERAQADGRTDASGQRSRAIDALFADYSARRAAKSLQDDDALRKTGASRAGWGGPTG